MVGLREPFSPCPWPPGVLDSPLISLLFWILICFSIAALFTKRYSIRPLIVALILRSIYYLGIGPTLNILGALNVSARGSPHSQTSSCSLHSDGTLACCFQKPLLCPISSSLLGSQVPYRPMAGTVLCLLPLPQHLRAAGTQRQKFKSPFGTAGSGWLCTLLAVHCPGALLRSRCADSYIMTIS